MKKFFYILSFFMVVLLVSWFFVPKNSHIEKTQSAKNGVSTQITTLKFAHHMPKESVLNKAALRFANEIEKKTDGKIKIVVYPNQELGNSHQMLELSRLGEIDILVTPSSKIGVALPSMLYADLPFLFPTQEDAHALFDGKVGSMLLSDLSKIDLLGVAFWDGGYKNLISKRPIQKIEDFKDLKIRVMKSRIIMEQFLGLDAKPITIDFQKIKKAFKDNIVDVAEITMYPIEKMGFDEVISNLTLSQHAYLVYILTFSKKSIAELPLDVQTTLIQSAKDITLWERQETKKENTRVLDEFKKQNLNVEVLCDDEKNRLKHKTAYIAKKYEDTIGSHIISKTQEYMHNKYNKDDVVVIGVDADLSMGAKGSGLAIKRGVELAVENINKQGGLLGKRVVVIAKDHQGISTQAKENIKEFIEDNKTIAVIGGKHSAIISSYMKEIQDAKLIFSHLGQQLQVLQIMGTKITMYLEYLSMISSLQVFWLKRH